MKMKIRDFLHENTDIDVCDDYTEECYIAYCGPMWLTPEGEIEFSGALDLEVEIRVPAELGNKYAMSRDMLHWRFAAMPVVDANPNDARVGVAAVKSPGSAYDKTGYNLLPAFAFAAGLLVVGAVSFAVGARRRK